MEENLDPGPIFNTFADAFRNWLAVSGKEVLNWLIRLAVSRGASPHDAHSCAQKVVAGVLARTDDEGPVALTRLRAYVRGVAQNIVREQIRLSQRRRHFRPLDEAGEDRGPYDPPDRGPTPSALARGAETKADAEKAYKSLDEDDREILRLAYDEKLTDREIGKLFDAKGDTVRHRRLKALQRLREAMAGSRQ